MPERRMAGYSGTPLARKLGFTASMTVVLVDPPPGYRQWLEPVPPGVRFAEGLAAAESPIAAAHVFVSQRTALRSVLQTVRRRLAPAGFVWMSWPKRASKVPTDVTEDTIRAVALPMGLVDVKVCAVSEVWSGLKLVVRRAERARPAGMARRDD